MSYRQHRPPSERGPAQPRTRPNAAELAAERGGESVALIVPERLPAELPAPPPPVPAPIWRTSHVAVFLGVCEKTVSRLVASGELSAFKFRNSLRFDPVEVRAWLARQRVRVAPRQEGRP